MTNSKTQKDEGNEWVRTVVESIYRNYGIEPGDMDDDEMSRVTNYYINGKADLKDDYDKSLLHKEKSNEEDLL